MRQRLWLLTRLALCSIICFSLQKIAFLLYHLPTHPEVTSKDFLQVTFHALPLDITTTGYILLLPFLLICISWFITGEQWSRWCRRIALVYYALASYLFTLFFVLDTTLYTYWGFKLDATILNYLDSPGDALASVSTLYVVVVSMIQILLTIVQFLLYRWLLPNKPLSRPRNRWSALAIPPIAAMLFICIRGGIGDGTANVSSVYYSEQQFLNHAAVNPGFNIFYSLVHQQHFAQQFRYLPDNECQTIIQQIYPPKSEEEILTDTLLRTQRPNILLIVWEGCGGQVAGCIGGPADVTPNLTRIANEGILFSQCYANSFRTDRGLVSIMTGWLGLPNASLMKLPNKCNNMPGLARKLKDAGYATTFWYGGDIKFTNMGGFMLANGFEHTYSDKDFTFAQRHYSDWGVADGVLLNRVADYVQSSNSEPWFTTVLTLSSHEPWEVPEQRLDIPERNAFAYTDAAIGNFIDRLKKSSGWNNTLVLIVPDHGVDIDHKHNTADIMHIPVVLTGGALRQQGKVIDTIINQSDVVATLLAQLNISHNDMPFSRNVLSTNYQYPTAIRTMPDNFTFIDSTGITTYDIAGEKVITPNQPNDTTRVVRGKAILQYLYDKTEEL